MLKKTVLALAICTLAATAVQANEITGYATYSIGHVKAKMPKIAKIELSDYKEIGGQTSSDRSSTGHKIVVGLNVHSYIALEAQYTDLGKAHYKGSFSGLTGLGTPVTFDDKLSLKTSGFGANIVGKYPIQDFTLFTKAGYHLMRTKINLKDSWVTPLGSYKDSVSKTVNKWVPSLGVGASYNLTPELAIVTEYERYQGVGNKKVNVDDEKMSFKHDIDFVSVGLRYNF